MRPNPVQPAANEKSAAAVLLRERRGAAQAPIRSTPKPAIAIGARWKPRTQARAVGSTRAQAGRRVARRAEARQAAVPAVADGRAPASARAARAAAAGNAGSRYGGGAVGGGGGGKG